LEGFAYRAEWSLLPFFQGFVAIAFFSVSVLWLQTLRTVQSNPVKNHRHEWIRGLDRADHRISPKRGIDKL